MTRQGSPASKRRRNRIPVSCGSCRALKTKCDGIRPICSTCAQNRRECVFAQQIATNGTAVASNTITVSQDYLRGLENRLELLEKARSPPVPPTDQQPSDQGLSACSVKTPQPVQTPSSVLVDANLSIGGISFTQLLLNMLHGQGNVEAQSMSTYPESRNRPLNLTPEELYATPDNATDVLDQYFTTRNTLTPLFHGPSARSVFFQALRRPMEERQSQPLTFALINMILALWTSHWVLDVETNPRIARRHYEIAMALLQPSLLRDWRLEHVQALLLAARYLQTTSCGDECWNVLGLAVRIAYGLRLHKEPPHSDTPPMRETKRRVWYAAYMLDMNWSMIYQRPSATRSADFSVSMPEDLDDDCIRDNGVLYPMPRRPSSISFCIEMFKLARVVERILARPSEEMSTAKDTAESIMALDDDLEKWYRHIPAHLILDYQNPEEPQWILAMRMRMIRILIHRPSLSDAIYRLQKDQLGQASLASQTLQASQKICLDAAMQSVDIVALRYQQTKGSPGLNWFNIYYLFNAVIVLVSHIIHHQASPALAKVETALDMIKEVSSNHSFAKRALSFLQGLLQCLYQSLAHKNPIGESTVFPDDFSLSSAMTQIPMPSNLGPDVFPDLLTLFAHTRDVALNLQAQLENIEAGDFTESTWGFDDLAQ